MRSINKEGQLIEQIAALPYRLDANVSGDPLRILLITSRETKRWVLPKGNLIKGLSNHQAAEQEAFEEAGISGAADIAPWGHYPYLKRLRNGVSLMIIVSVFPMLVTSEAEDWPERDERETRWFTRAEAAAVVDEPELASLLLSFSAFLDN